MRAAIRVTRNFERDLAAIEEFLREQEALPEFETLKTYSMSADFIFSSVSIEIDCDLSS